MATRSRRDRRTTLAEAAAGPDARAASRAASVWAARCSASSRCSAWAASSSEPARKSASTSRIASSATRCRMAERFDVVRPVVRPVVRCGDRAVPSHERGRDQRRDRGHPPRRAAAAPWRQASSASTSSRTRRRRSVLGRLVRVRTVASAAGGREARSQATSPTIARPITIERHQEPDRRGGLKEDPLAVARHEVVADLRRGASGLQLADDLGADRRRRGRVRLGNREPLAVRAAELRLQLGRLLRGAQRQAPVAPGPRRPPLQAPAGQRPQA